MPYNAPHHARVRQASRAPDLGFPAFADAEGIGLELPPISTLPMIKVLYFARLREQLVTDEEVLELPVSTHTVSDLLALLRARGDPWSQVLAEETATLAAVNQEIARLETPIHDGDEVAFFPPVTGG